MVRTKKQTALAVLVVVLISLSLRSPMSTVGPLTGQFQRDLGLSSFSAGFVTTIPMIAFSAMAPIAGRITVAVQSKKLVAACFAIIGAGVLLRSFGGVAGLYVGTTCMGLAIGTMNVLMPALIRKRFPDQIGLMMGFYLTAQTAASACFSGTCQDIAAALGSWKLGLAAPVVLCLVSIGACLLSGPLLAVKLEAPAAEQGGRCITRKHVAVALYMGTQSFIYFSMVAWLPSIAESVGAVTGDSGMLLLVMQSFGMAACLVMPMITQRAKRRDLLACFGAFLFVLSFAAMAFSGGAYGAIMLGAILCGLACSGTLSLSLTIIAEQGRNAGETAKISALSQCIGYALAAVGPSGLGYLYDVCGRWEVVLYCLIVLSALMTLLGLYAGKPEKSGNYTNS